MRKKIFNMINRIEKIKKIVDKHTDRDYIYGGIVLNDKKVDRTEDIGIDDTKELKEQLNQLEKELKEMVE